MATLLRALRIFLRAFAPMGAVTLLALFALSGSKGAEAPLISLEDVVLETQRKRTETLHDVDVLILGDSSALMGVDAVQMSRELTRHVESLALVAPVGPAGYAAVLRRYLQRGERPSSVVLLLNGTGLTIEGATFQQMGFEARVLADMGTPGPREARPLELLSARRAANPLFALFERVVSPSAAGHYGDAYGTGREMADALDEGHGTLLDPNRLAWPADAPVYEYRCTAGFLERLSPLRQALEQSGQSRVRLGMTPTPATLGADRTERSRDDMQARLLAELALPERAALTLPATLPPSMFATATHLNRQGRAAFSSWVARQLR